jgi:hypothetical protein
MKPRWAPILLMAAAGAPSRAQSSLPDHFVLTSAQVARAISVAGTPISAQQVSLPARVVATVPDPELDVVSIQSSQARLACHQPGQCLPFYALLSSPPPATQRVTAVKEDFTMRAGDHAILTMDDDRAHIRVRVISLENGMAGKWIRVSSLDHKQIYFGEVINSSLLKGSF